MSFTSKIKFEAAGVFGAARHCLLAEFTGLLAFRAETPKDGASPKIALFLDTELALLKFLKLADKLFGYSCERYFKDGKLRGAGIEGGEAAFKALASAGIPLRGPAPAGAVNPAVIRNECCKKSFLRGAFLAAGTVSDPDKSHHLEFFAGTKGFAENLRGALAFFGLNAKTTARNDRYAVYLKDAGQIADALGLMGLSSSTLEYQNLLVNKEMSNYINRKVNFSNANDEKTINASVRQAGGILYIRDTKGLGWLPAHLRAVAELRLEYPELSLSELGEMLTPPLTKSGVSHRLKKLRDLSEKLRDGE